MARALAPGHRGESVPTRAMGRPKGHRLTPEQRKRCAPKNPRGGRKIGSPNHHHGPRKSTIRRTTHARTPDEKIAEKDAIRAGASIISAESLRRPRFVFKLPNGEIRVDYLTHDTEDQ